MVKAQRYPSQNGKPTVELVMIAMDHIIDDRKLYGACIRSIYGQSKARRKSPVYDCYDHINYRVVMVILFSIMNNYCAIAASNSKQQQKKVACPSGVFFCRPLALQLYV